MCCLTPLAARRNSDQIFIDINRSENVWLKVRYFENSCENDDKKIRAIVWHQAEIDSLYMLYDECIYTH